jgi:5'-nucleotidase/UDP-sugar diphosphatase
MKNSSLFLILTCLVLFSCNEKPSGNQQVVILHTNDMHAHIDNFSKLAAYKSAIEDQYEHVILVSAGDLFSGNPYVDYHEEKGYPMIDLMNEVGYSVSVIGNHEFDYGQEILSERMEQANFPFICANFTVENDILEQPEASFSIAKNGLKLNFVGLVETGNDGLPSTHPLKVQGISFQHGFEVLDEIELDENANATIALSHMGFRSDLEMTSKTDMFDVIIGGHSHTLLREAIDTNNTIVVQAGDDVDWVGKLVLNFTNGELVSVEDEMVNLKEYTAVDSVIQFKIDAYYSNETLRESVGVALSTMRGKNELGALFTDAQVTMCNLDFCFQNNGGLRIYEIPEGEISIATVYELDPFGNELIQIDMSKAEIEGLIKSSYDRSPGINFQIGGGIYTIFTDENENWQYLELFDDKGVELHQDSTYSVGLNSYIVNSYTFDHADPGKSLNITTAENIISYLQKVGKVDYAGVVRQEIKKD